MILSVLYYSIQVLMLIFAGLYIYMTRAFSISTELLLFLIGACVFLIARLFIRKLRDILLFAETFQHEFTHMFFAYLTFVRVYDFSSSLRRGGHIKTDRVNMILTLSPYTVPLLPIIIGAAGFIVKAVYVRPLILIAGFAMMQYLFALLKDLFSSTQPDVKVYGKMLSYMLIAVCLINTIVYSYYILNDSFSIVFRIPVFVVKGLLG